MLYKSLLEKALINQQTSEYLACTITTLIDIFSKPQLF